MEECEYCHSIQKSLRSHFSEGPDSRLCVTHASGSSCLADSQFLPIHCVSLIHESRDIRDLLCKNSFKTDPKGEFGSKRNCTEAPTRNTTETQRRRQTGCIQTTEEADLADDTAETMKMTQEILH
ncbi:hypothetical protein Y1Q_0023476 [Alligator mississippiensis]|uniref:Uncharacterized protein n=1 Tax=Alligator mississippiensis TaxID=8496 RepID=A0A151NPQ0_ALLMI|nr:hypothetical protein Y1Q_0023476 [Alligator mississippiensis]